MTESRLPAFAFAAIITFAALARGGYDLWAATAVYLAVLALAGSVFARSCWPDRARGYAVCLAWPLAGLAAALALSVCRAVNPGESCIAGLDWLAAIAAFFTALNVFADEDAVTVFLAGMAPVLLIELAVNLSQRSAQHPFVHMSPGTLVNANVATAFMIAWVPPLADRWRRAAAGAPRRLWGAALTVSVAGLLLFHSVWGALCLAAALPFFSGPRGLAGLIRRRPRLIAAVAAVAAAAFTALLWYKFAHALDLDGNLVPPDRRISRLLWWASGMRMFLDHPWTGVGLGNFGSAYLSYKVGTGQHTLFAHSLPVKLLAETGGLGTVAFALFLIAWLRRLAPHRDDVPPRWPFLLGALLMLAYSVLSVGLEYLANLLTLWVFLGIAAAGRPARSWKARRSIVFAAAATGLAGVPYLLSPLQASRLCVAAQERLAARDWAAAERGFAAAAGTFPLDFESERGWAEALFGRYQSGRDPRDLDAAIAHQARAAGLDRRQDFLWRELGALRLARGDAEAAGRLFQKAAALHRRPGR